VSFDPLAVADELRAMASNGLLFTKDPYDRERYERLLVIAAELGAATSDLPTEKLLQAWRGETGYITPKVGVAAAVADEEGRLLLVRRADNGLWAMPGGWSDVAEAPSAGAVREVAEETGLSVRATRLVGVYDGRLHGLTRLLHLYHLVFACEPMGGTLRPNAEVLAAAYFAPDDLPALSPGHAGPIADAFAALRDPQQPARFD
jgi:ADP-ribose pyrophosphatase YjhB (NUDIX family)